MAKVTSEYIHFKKTPAIDSFVRDLMSKFTRRLRGSWQRANIKLKTIVSARAPGGQAKEFLAELFILRPKMAPVVIKKKNPDLRTAIHEAVSAAERVVE